MTFVVAVVWGASSPSSPGAQKSARLVSPGAGQQLSSPEAWVGWKKVRSATRYRLLAGSTRGSGNYYRSPSLGKKTGRARVSGIPRDGSPVWVTLKSRQGGRWRSSSRAYRAPLWNHLVECAPVTDVPAWLLQSIAENAGLTQFASFLKHDMRVCRVKYQTTYKGRQITASGLFSYPLNAAPGFPVAVVQNGMIFGDLEAPSAFYLSILSPDLSRYIGYEFLAAAGYFVIFPDWIGFGASSDLMFPMYDREYSASASIDLMRAAFEHIRSAKIPAGDKLFIAGYSMGGYTANCLLHALESDDPFGRPVTAAALGAGGYNLAEVMGKALAGETESRPDQVAMFLASYNETNDWGRPLSDFFQQPYATQIPTLLSGDYDTEEIFAQLPADGLQLLNPVFVANAKTGGEPVLTGALERNSIHNWSPVSRVRLYHSRDDERILFSDSWNAYQNMLAGGSTQAEFVEIPAGNHYNAVFGFMELVLPWFESLR